MFKMKSILKLVLFFVVILLGACKKEYESKQQKIILLTKPAGWLTLKIEQKTGSGAWNDVTNTLDPLAVDNILIFDPWYKWAINEGELKFPGNAQIVGSGVWSFKDNETKIQFEGGNLNEIIELTETSLQTTVVTGDVTTRYTYKHP